MLHFRHKPYPGSLDWLVWLMLYYNQVIFMTYFPS